LPIIIGESTIEEDRVDLPLATKTGTPIPNVKRLERVRPQLEASVQILGAQFPDNELRSITGTYNCIGMVFAARRTHIHPKHVTTILTDDGYRPVAEAEVKRGDLAIYRDERDEIQHAGVVMEVVPVLALQTDRLRRIRVLSKWGADGEYIHWVGDVPSFFGVPHYYTERCVL
jgi:hypothetical protein